MSIELIHDTIQKRIDFLTSALAELEPTIKGAPSKSETRRLGMAKYTEFTIRRDELRLLLDMYQMKASGETVSVRVHGHSAIITPEEREAYLSEPGPEASEAPSGQEERLTLDGIIDCMRALLDDAIALKLSYIDKAREVAGTIPRTPYRLKYERMKIVCDELLRAYVSII